jgi:hypothetical protein
MAMFHDTEAQAQLSVDKIVSDTADSLNAVANAASHVTKPKAPKGGDEDGTGAGANKKAKDATKDAADAWKDYEKQLISWMDVAEDVKRDNQKLIDLQRDLEAETMLMNGATEEEVRQWRLAADGVDEYGRKLSDANAKVEEARKRRDEQQDTARKERARQAEETRALGDTLKAGFDDIFMSATQGADAATEAVKRLIAELLRMIAMKAATKFIDSIFGVTPAANGMAFNMAGARFFSQGGIVSGPTAFAFAGGNLGVMGEAGPEAIMPLKRGADGKLGVAGGGNVQVFNYAGADISVERDRDNVRIMVDRVSAKIAGDIARGGSSVSSAIERAYKVRR